MSLPQFRGSLYIDGQWREADSGRKRKYYGLTKKGTAWLRSQQKQWESLLDAMTSLGLVGTRSGKS